MAAQVGVSLVPESVEGVRVKGVVYRRLPEPAATSPIIMSRRLQRGDGRVLRDCAGDDRSGGVTIVINFSNRN